MYLLTLLTAESPSNTTIHLLHNDKLGVHISALTDHHKATHKTLEIIQLYTRIILVIFHNFTIYLLCMSLIRSFTYWNCVFNTYLIQVC